MLPSQFLDLNRYEKGFIIACIDVRTEKEAKEAKKIRKK
nr:MAG TPA: protein of unknown function (DUF2309) [Caudoviricetes sp.]